MDLLKSILKKQFISKLLKFIVNLQMDTNHYKGNISLQQFLQVKPLNFLKIYSMLIKI